MYWCEWNANFQLIITYFIHIVFDHSFFIRKTIYACYIYLLLHQISSIFRSQILSIRCIHDSILLLTETNMLSLLFCKSVHSSKWNNVRIRIFSTSFYLKSTYYSTLYGHSWYKLDGISQYTVVTSEVAHFYSHINHSKTWLLTNPFYESFFITFFADRLCS